MRSRVSYALHTLVGPWLLLPALGVELVAFLMRGMPWRGEGMWTIEWFAIPLFIIGPLCAGAAAVDAARLSQSGNIHLVLSVPRPPRVYLRAAAWCAGPIIGLHAFIITTGVLVGQVRQPSVGWGSMLAAALLQCAAVVWFAALGSAVGRLTSPLLAGLIGGGGYVLYYVLGEALTSEPAFRLLNIGGATVTMIGKAYHPGYLIGQATIFALTSSLLLLLPVRLRAGYKVPTLSGVVAVLVAVVAIMVSPAVFPSQRTVEVARPPDLCFDAKPQVCLYDEHRRYAGLVIGQVQTLVRAAEAAGYPAFVPERVMEDSRAFHASGPGVRPLWLPASTYEEGRLPLEDVAFFLLTPTHCEELFGVEPPPAEYDARFFSLLATWLHLTGVDLDRSPVEPKILTPAEVADILDDFARCDLGGRG